MALKDKVYAAIGGVGVIVLIILIIIVGPLIGVWAIKTLWGVNIGYTFWTWLAALLFFAACSGSGRGGG